LVLLLCFYMLTGCDGSVVELMQPRSPEPQAGLRDYQRPLLVEVPGGLANAAGGNLFVLAGGLSVETALGVEEVAPVYNSATGRWRFGIIDMTYLNAVFVDHTGAEFDVTTTADGAVIPGSVWIKVDADTIMAKGGLVFEFGSLGELVAKHRLGQQCPRILYEDVTGGPTAQLRIRQQDCGARGEWTAYTTGLYSLDLDEQGRVVQVVDRAGHGAVYTYDGSGNLTTARDGLDVQQGWPGYRYEYGALNGLLTAATNSEEERVEYEYYSPAALGAPRLQFATQVVQAGEGNLQYRFDYYAGSTPGIPETVVTDPMGDSRRFFFDDSRRVHGKAYEAVGERELFGYIGPELRPASHTLANGATESYTWDANENILTITQPSGNVVVHSYADANGISPFSKAMSSKRDDLGLLGAWTYTDDVPVDYRRLETAANGAGEVARYAWYPNGGYTRLASVVEPNGIVRAFDEYNPLGQATRIIHGEVVETVSYDEVGNRTGGNNGTSPEVGGVIARRFDADRNPFEVTVAGTDGQESVIRLPRGSDGRVLFVDRPPLGLGAGPDHRFTYNTLGQPVEREEMVDGAWHSTFFEYDRRGQKTAERLPNGMRREWVRDQRGRLREQRAYRDGVLEGEIIFTYVNGNLVSVNDSHRGSEVHSYDPATGLPAVVQYAGGETLEYGFDPRSRLVKETYRQPDATVVKVVEHEYDLADREIRTYDDGQLVIDRTIRDGQVDCIETGNGLERCFTYDPVLGLRDSASTTNENLEVLETTTLSHGLTRSPVNWEAYAATSIPGLGDAEATFTIGPATDPTVPGSEVGKRVLAWNNGSHSPPRSQSYAYDSLGNQVDDVDGDLYDYNAEGNRLLVATVDGVSLTYTHDAAGFADSLDGIPIEWTAMGRMASYGASEVEWDMQGRALAATDTSIEPPAVRDWSRWGGRIEVDGAGFLAALDLGEVVLGFGGARRYRHFDFRGNVSFVSDEDGEIVTLYRYSPYGVDLVLGDGSDNVRFVGRSGIGPFVWLGDRMYDPRVGRFLSPDPVFNLLNQHSYTVGNPVWFNDATGRDAVPRNGHQFGVVLSVALAAASFALALVGFALVGVPVTYGTALVLATAALVVAGVGVVVTFNTVAWSTPSDSNTGCGCTPTVEMGIGADAAQAENPSGAAPPGGGDGGDGGSVAYPKGSLAAGGMGGSTGGGFGGGIGVVPSCGLTGIEFLFFVGFVLSRIKRRRTA
jgi:RHS repeat-associated protein